MPAARCLENKTSHALAQTEIPSQPQPMLPVETKCQLTQKANKKCSYPYVQYKKEQYFTRSVKVAPGSWCNISDICYFNVMFPLAL